MRDLFRSNWKHLRVLFQLTLAPIFLWGALLSGARPSARIAFGFVVFHFLLYTGITAYNSVCDRDEGAIGGLEHPPQISPALLPIALALKTLGLLLAVLCGPAFAAIYLVFVALSFLYSHPRTRWKANPVLSTVVVCGGQGMLGFLAGWAAARGGLSSLSTADGVLGILSAGLTTLGMYPITQVYQMAEDARRGDRTLCVVLGYHRALSLSQLAFAAAGLAVVRLCWRRFGIPDAVVMAGAYAAILAALQTFRSRFPQMNPRIAFRSVMVFLYTGSASFAAFILWEWLKS